MSTSTTVKTLLLTDLVGSTSLTEKLGDERASEISARHDRVGRELLKSHDGQEIDKTDGFLLLFERPSQAVGYAIAYHQALARLSRELGVELAARGAIHLGEVILRENPADEVARGAKPLEVEGLAKPTAARVMSLAQGGQTLLTRGAFDLARRAVVGSDAETELEWRAHGSYELKGVNESLEIFEVGLPGLSLLKPPPDAEMAKRSVREGEEATLGWRPASGLPIPGREHWILDHQAGEGGFGEVWIAEHEKTHTLRVFKFCFEADRLRGLRREVVLFRLLKESLGHREDIAQILDWNFDEAPYFLEVEHSEGGDLLSWVEERGGLAAVSLEDRIEIVAQAAVAVAAAHSAGVLHKDIKPANLLLRSHPETGKPSVRLTDFGIGLVTGREALAPGVTAAGFTQTLLSSSSAGSATGTPLYMPPEVLAGQPHTSLSDLYSLGVVLYQVVAGDFRQALAPGWEREIDDELLREDIAACVDGVPERRLASAAELAKRLRALDERRAERRAEAKRVAEVARYRRRRRQFTVATVAGIALTCLVGGLAWRERARASEEERLKEGFRRQLYISDMNLVSEAYEHGALRRMVELLEKHLPQARQEDLRGFEWFHWWHSAHLEAARTPPQVFPFDAVLTMPSGEGVAALTWETSLTLLDRNLETVNGALLGRRFYGAATALSPDGSWLAQLGARGQVFIWDAHEAFQARGLMQPVTTLEHRGYTKWKAALTFSPADPLLAVGDETGRISVWKTDTWEKVADWQTPGQVMGLSFVPRRGELVAAVVEPTARALFTYELTTGRALRRVDAPGINAFWMGDGVVYSPEAQLLATAGVDDTVVLWTEALERAHTLPADGPVLALSFSADGHTLAAGTDRASSLLVWKLGGEPILTHHIKGHERQVSGVALSRDGSTLWSSSNDSTVKRWDLADAVRYDRIERTSLSFQVAYSDDGRHLLFVPSTADGATEFRLRDVDARETAELEGGSERYWRVGSSPYGGAFVAVTRDGELRVGDMSTGTWLSRRRVDPTEMDVALSVSADGRRVAWPLTRKTPERRFVLLDMESGQEWTLPGKDAARPESPSQNFPYATFSPTGRLLVEQQFSFNRVWDLSGETPVLQHALEGWGAQTCAAFSLDDSILAICHLDNKINLYDSRTGELSKVLRGHTDHANDLAFSADGTTLVSAGQDRTARFWDVETGQLRSTLADFDHPVTRLAFSPRGDSLATISGDASSQVGELRIWRIATRERVERDLAAASAPFTDWSDFTGYGELSCTVTEGRLPAGTRFQLALKLRQEGARVTGESATLTTRSTVRGSVSDGLLAWQAESEGACPGRSSGTAEVVQGALAFHMEVSDCQGELTASCAPFR